MDWLPWLMGIGLSIPYVVLRAIAEVNYRRRPAVEPTSQPQRPLRSAIPQSVQDEIDQKPAWWDKEFHKLLVSTDSKYVERGEDSAVIEITFGGQYHAHTIPAPREYLGCTCRDCKRARYGH